MHASLNFSAFSARYCEFTHDRPLRPRLGIDVMMVHYKRFRSDGMHSEASYNRSEGSVVASVFLEERIC